MTALASTLTLFLAVQDAMPAATTTASSTCELTDNACKARLFIDKAAKAAPPQRAMYLFTAHRSYVALFAKTGDARHLCAARMNFDRSLAVKGQSDQQRASFEKSRTELEALEQKHAPRCEVSRKRNRPRPEKVAEAVSPEPVGTAPAGPEPTSAAPEKAREVATAMLDAGPELPAEAGLLDVPTARTELRPVRAVPLEVPKTAFLRPARVPGRSLVIAGGTTIGLGLALTGVAGYAGVRVADASRRAFDNYEQVQGQGDADALATQASLRRDFDRWLPVTVSTAVVGTTALIVGAVLVRMGVRRMRDPLRAALVPVPNGLAIHARF
jgi:hypothetical protein